MVKAIRMPDLHQFKPGFFDLSARCGGWELEHLIIVREAFLPHGCLRLWQGSVAEAGDWLHFRMVPVPLLATSNFCKRAGVKVRDEGSPPNGAHRAHNP